MDERVLVLTPEARDVRAVLQQLAAAGIDAQATSAAELVTAVRDCTLGAALLTVEALDQYDIGAVTAAVEAQPAWSDCPILLLTRRGHVASANRDAIIERANVTLLERPLQPATLVAAARAALRARARQRKSELYLHARDAAEAQLREAAATLEARVAERTATLTQEIERRTHAEAKLRDSEELYRFTINLNAQVAWSTTARGAPLSVGPGWPELTGINFDEFAARGMGAIAHPDDAARLAATRARTTAEGRAFDLEFRIRMPDGNYRWLRSRGSPRRGADGAVLQWYGTIEDVDARRNAEARFNQLQADLIHVSRVSAMGAMASVLAHELNQPLTATANYVRGSRKLLGTLAGDTVTTVHDALVQADASTAKAAEILRRLRDLVAGGDARRRIENLPELIREAGSMVLADAGALGIDYMLDLDPQAAVVSADRIQIQQVLINLLRNAVEALGPTGVRRIAIQTRRAGTHCEIAVHDSGPGVHADAAVRLFEPFHSTKETGLGVGLSICRTIVEAHGGKIWHAPQPGGGTIFRFTLQHAPDLPAPLAALAGPAAG